MVLNSIATLVVNGLIHREKAEKIISICFQALREAKLIIQEEILRRKFLRNNSKRESSMLENCLLELDVSERELLQLTNDLQQE